MVDEPDETTRLRRRVARLEAEVERANERADDDRADPSDGADVGPRRGRWRPVVCAILVLVAAVLAPLAVVASWTNDEISDTARFVRTVEPLAANPAVQAAITDRITSEIVDRIDVQAVTKQAFTALGERGVPPAAVTTLSSLASPLAAQIEDFVRRQVSRIVHSPQFASAWVTANRAAHSQMVAVLTGRTGDAVEAQGNAVRVNLAAVIETVKQSLGDRGFALASRIPEVDAEFTLLQSADLSKAQTGFRLLGAIAHILPWVVLGLLAVSVALARSRRRAMVGGALAIAASMLLLGLGLNLFRVIYLDNIPSQALPADAAAAVYDTLVHFIRVALRSVLVVFLAIAAMTWATGPWSGAVALRRGLGRAVETIQHGSDRAGLRTGPVGRAAYAWRSPARVVILGAVVLVYVMASRPTAGFTLALLAITLLLLAVLEVLARPGAAENAAQNAAENEA